MYYRYNHIEAHTVLFRRDTVITIEKKLEERIKDYLQSSLLETGYLNQQRHALHAGAVKIKLCHTLGLMPAMSYIP